MAQGGDGNLYSYVGGNPVTYVDPWGLLKLNLLPAGSGEYRSAAGAADSPGVATVYAHGNPGSLVVEGKKMDAKALMERLREAGWTPGMPIKINACYTGNGSDSFGQKVANESQTTVTAPDGNVDTRGNSYYGPQWLPVPGWPRGDGKGWNTFGPARR